MAAEMKEREDCIKWNSINMFFKQKKSCSYQYVITISLERPECEFH